MYERFTDRARRVFQYANQEAQRFNHEYLSTEHILLGLLKEGSGVAANVLRNLGLDLGKIRAEVEKISVPGPEMVTLGKLPQTPRAKKVVEYAMDEAKLIGHTYVGTEHILLGLTREADGVAAHVLLNMGIKLNDVRREVVGLIGMGPDAMTRAALLESLVLNTNDPSAKVELEPASSLEKDLRVTLNRHSAENGSNTPDYILSEFLLGCLDAFNRTVKRREVFYGRGPVEASVPNTGKTSN